MYNLKRSGNVSKTVKSGTLLNILKYADITPAFKTGDTEGISNHGPTIPILICQKYLKNSVLLISIYL